MALAHTPRCCEHMPTCPCGRVARRQRAAGARSRRRGAPQRRALCSNSGARAAGVLRAHGVRVIAALCPLAQPLSLSPVHTHRDPAIIRSCPQCQCAGAAARAHEDERECTSERAEDAGTAWERSHLSASGLALRLLIEVVGDGVLRWLFAVMNLAGALTSGIARPSRACKVGQQLPARRAAGGAQTRSCAGASASEARGFRGVGALSSALARLFPALVAPLFAVLFPSEIEVLCKACTLFPLFGGGSTRFVPAQ